jgi:hypothetical protein
MEDFILDHANVKQTIDIVDSADRHGSRITV